MTLSLLDTQATSNGLQRSLLICGVYEDGPEGVQSCTMKNRSLYGWIFSRLPSCASRPAVGAWSRRQYQTLCILLTRSFLYIHILYVFSLSYLNYLHHYSCALEPSLSKMKVIWTQALWLDNMIIKKATKWPMGGKHPVWFPLGVEWSRMAWDFLSILRITRNLKLMHF